MTGTTINVARIPEDLHNRRQWVMWKSEIREGKPTKVPYTARSRARANAPDTGITCSLAMNAYRKGCYAGIGYILSADDPFTLIDLDNCRNPATGAIEPWAQEIIDRLNSYSELSVSGTGVHIWVVASKLGPRCRKGNIEMYDQKRFSTLSGNHLAGTPSTIEARQDEIAVLYDELFPEKTTRNTAPAGTTSLDDAEVIEHIRASGQASKFDRLWSGDTSEYGGDDSRADLALCCILAFWTKRDPAAIDRLFRQSGLYRDKWERADYADRTVDRAIDLTTEVYEPSNDGGAIPFSKNGSAPEEDDVKIFTSSADTDEPEGWEPPQPLRDVADLPSFPTHALPDPIKVLVEEIADAKQVPVDLPGMLSLAVLATAAAGRVQVEIWEGWTEPVNIYAAVVLPPGERKTLVHRDLTAPLERYERSLIAEMRDTIATEQARHDLLEAEYRAAVNRAAKLTGDEQLAAQGDARSLSVKLANHSVPPEPRLLADDVTPEKLVSLMAEQDGRIALLSAEGGVFEMMNGRYNKSGVLNLDVYLKAHSGDPIRVDRRSRSADFIEQPTLTLGLAVQPIVIDGLFENTVFRGRGIVARFLVSVPTPMVGHRAVRTRAVSESVVASYEEVIESLLQMQRTQGFDGSPTPNLLKMTPEAERRIEAFAGQIEPRLGEFGDMGHMADWGGKLSGAVGRIAALLHLAENWTSSTPWRSPITEDTMLAACEIGHYLIAHAQAVYTRMGADPDVASAGRILRWIVDHTHSEDLTDLADGLTITKRDIQQALRRSFQKPSDLDKPLQVLVDHGYLRPLPIETDGPGRKPSPTFVLNPSTLSSKYSKSSELPLRNEGQAV